jgi:p38 MAP kinase
VESLPPYPKKDFREFFVGANPTAIDVLSHLLEMDPDRRPSAEQALEHEYFSKYHLPKDEVMSWLCSRLNLRIKD